MNFQTRLTPYLRRSRHDGQQAIAELQGSTLGATYLTGLQIDEMLARYSSAGDKTYLTDVLGSITAQTDATGAITQRYSYSAYGETQGNPQTTATDPNSVQYTGRENDGTGLYYYRARYYDPQLKRFTQSDPIGLNGGINEFGYVGGDPVSLTDPTGECPWCIAAGMGALSGAGIDLALQLLQNGGELDCVDWRSVGTAALSGAALSGLGPTGYLLGRGGARASQYGYNSAPGILNRGNVRFGWSGPKSGSDVLSGRVGNQHFDVPGTGVPSGANPLRDGAASGALGGGTNRAAGDSCGCKK